LRLLLFVFKLGDSLIQFICLFFKLFKCWSRLLTGAFKFLKLLLVATEHTDKLLFFLLFDFDSLLVSHNLFLDFFSLLFNLLAQLFMECFWLRFLACDLLIHQGCFLFNLLVKFFKLFLKHFVFINNFIFLCLVIILGNLFCDIRQMRLKVVDNFLSFCLFTFNNFFVLLLKYLVLGVVLSWEQLISLSDSFWLSESLLMFVGFNTHQLAIYDDINSSLLLFSKLFDNCIMEEFIQ